MTNKTQTADILRAAANKIREVGWTRGAALRNGHVCALGAVGTVTGCEVTEAGIWSEVEGADGVAFDVANDALRRWLKEANGFHRSVVDWNDALERTKDDVVTGMEKAAAWIEEQT